jgi:hypothetical protein
MLGALWGARQSGPYLGRLRITTAAIRAKVSLATLRLPTRPGTTSSRDDGLAAAALLYAAVATPLRKSNRAYLSG